MSRRTPTPLSMSQTKEELLRQLNMSTEIYEMMASETANIYTWLTKNPNNFKQQNRDLVPPFDWSDITELAKQEAARKLSQQGINPTTSYYWQMGETPRNDNNWIAIWFLYHKFRYRDGRNRAKDSKKGTKKHHKSGSDGKKSSTKPSSSHRGSVTSSSPSSPSAKSTEAAAQPVHYESTEYSTAYSQPTNQYNSYLTEVGTSRPLYDPVRDNYPTGR